MRCCSDLLHHLFCSLFTCFSFWCSFGPSMVLQPCCVEQGSHSSCLVGTEEKHKNRSSGACSISFGLRMDPSDCSSVHSAVNGWIISFCEWGRLLGGSQSCGSLPCKKAKNPPNVASQPKPFISQPTEGVSPVNRFCCFPWACCDDSCSRRRTTLGKGSIFPEEKPSAEEELRSHAASVTDSHEIFLNGEQHLLAFGYFSFYFPLQSHQEGILAAAHWW